MAKTLGAMMTALIFGISTYFINLLQRAALGDQINAFDYAMTFLGAAGATWMWGALGVVLFESIAKDETHAEPPPSPDDTNRLWWLFKHSGWASSPPGELDKYARAVAAERGHASPTEDDAFQGFLRMVDHTMTKKFQEEQQAKAAAKE